jgi:hypothetical protein
MKHDTTQATIRSDDTVSNLLTEEDAGKRFHITRRKLNDLVRRGKLECVHISTKVRRFTPEQLQRFIEDCTKGPRIDKKRSGRISSPKRTGGEKSAIVSGKVTVEELRSLCRSKKEAK